MSDQKPETPKPAHPTDPSEENRPMAGKPAVAARKPSPRVAFVNYDQCTGCEACIAVAPWDNCLIRISEEPVTSHVKTNNAACTGCTLCMKICPWDAITMVPRPAQ